jgi:hypothetical protein
VQRFLERLKPVWTPHPGQLDFLASDAKIRVLACGRRWGKTDVCAVSILAALFRPSPTRHILLAPTQDQAGLLFDRLHELLERLLDHEGRSDRPKVRRSPYPRLEFGPHRVAARSGHVGRSLRGNEATDLVVDEAAFLPEEIVVEVAMPMLATTNGRLTLISTPRGFNHFWRFFQLGQEAVREESAALSALRGSVWSRRAPTSESPFVSKEFLNVQRELISERAYRVEYEADFLDSAGRVFRTEALDACLCGGFDRPPEPPFFVGVDWARYADFTAVVVLAGSKGEARLVHIERFQGAAWRDQVARTARIVERFPGARVLCDGTGLGDPLHEMLRESLPDHHVQSKPFTSAFKSELVDRLAWMFENGNLRMLPEPELLRELQHFEARQSDSGSRKLAAMSGFHDDLVIALALAAWQLPRSASGGLRLGAPRAFGKAPKRPKGMAFSSDETA